MDKYEITYLVTDEAILDNNPVTKAVEKVGGTVVTVKKWGQKNLAYPIKKQGTAFYATVVAELESSMLAELEKMLRMDQKILRSLIVKGVYEPRVETDGDGRRERSRSAYDKPVMLKEDEIKKKAASVISMTDKVLPVTDDAKVSDTKKESKIAATKTPKIKPAKPAKKAEAGVTDEQRLAQLEGKLKELLKE
jgi:small subunit ribosomal protein S6